MKTYTEGRALIIVIIVMAMLLILAPAIVLSSNAEVFQTVKYEDRMQAQLYARSGIDAALGWLIQDGYINEEFRSISYNRTAYLKGNFNSYNISSTVLTDAADISVDIIEEDDGIHLTSTGVYNGATKKVELTLILTTVGAPGYSMPYVDKALFVQEYGDAIFNNNGGAGQIIGDFGANTTTDGSLDFSGAEITGDVWLHALYETVIEGSFESGTIYLDQDELIYPTPDFPVYPDYFQFYGSDNAIVTVEKGDEVTIDLSDENYNFRKIDVGGTLNIDLGFRDVEIVCDELNVTGNINLLNPGTLTIYLHEAVYEKQNTNPIYVTGTINAGELGSEASDLIIFYDGLKEPDIRGLVVGSIVILRSDFSINGNAGIVGNVIVVGDGKITIGGTADAVSRIIYAPNSYVLLSGNSTVTGAIVADSAGSQGDYKIIYDDTLDIGSLPPDILPIPGYNEIITADIVNKYYWQ